MDNRGEATVSGVVGVIAATSDGFVTPRETGQGMVLWRCFPLRILTNFKLYLALFVLYTPVWDGAVVDSISLSGRSQRRRNIPATVANNKIIDGKDDGNDVDESLKSSAFGGSSSVAFTKMYCTAEALIPLGVPPPLLSLQKKIFPPHQ